MSSSKSEIYLNGLASPLVTNMVICDRNMPEYCQLGDLSGKVCLQYIYLAF